MIRDGGHDWRGNCKKCSQCGLNREKAHEWHGCKCSACEQTRHDWRKDCEICSACSAHRTKAHSWERVKFDRGKCRACGKVSFYCQVCDGRGRVGGMYWSRKCKNCDGYGQTTDGRRACRSKCNACLGTGRRVSQGDGPNHCPVFSEEVCKQCSGDGSQSS
jgi:hypothetical protein